MDLVRLTKVFEHPDIWGQLLVYVLDILILNKIHQVIIIFDFQFF